MNENSDIERKDCFSLHINLAFVIETYKPNVMGAREIYKGLLDIDNQ